MKKEIKKVSLVKKILGAAVMGAALLTSSLPVLAYTPKHVMYADEVASEVVFSKSVDAPWDNADIELSDDESITWTFTSEDGESVIVIDESDMGINPYLFCSHSYIVGTLSKHYRYSDGSCKVEYFNAKRCDYCHDTVIGDLIKTTTWVKCPH